MQTPDEILVERARGRDRSACEELFQRFRMDAYRVAYRLLGNEQDALDAVQDAFIKAFLALGDFDGRSGFRYWFLRIAANAALDLGRKRKRRPGLSLGDGKTGLPEPAEYEDPARGLHRQDLRRALDAALNALSPKIRTTFILFAELGMSYKDIAETQGIAIGTVMSRINAARTKLQQSLDWDKLKGLDEPGHFQARLHDPRSSHEHDPD
ncbi:RNA polymerase sigma factor [Aquisphaera insulae]|uniref:RNA polymerase sigma factor n=1 Tax=Aquisphaera insulae TaxID=2712864 RepID=UPI00202F6892|nr:sigma-70 family RNA polymerase sigma factor [Aquisphaera insulae]